MNEWYVFLYTIISFIMGFGIGYFVMVYDYRAEQELRRVSSIIEWVE